MNMSSEKIKCLIAGDASIAVRSLFGVGSSSADWPHISTMKIRKMRTVRRYR